MVIFHGISMFVDFDDHPYTHTYWNPNEFEINIDEYDLIWNLSSKELFTHEIIFTRTSSISFTQVHWDPQNFHSRYCNVDIT